MEIECNSMCTWDCARTWAHPPFPKKLHLGPLLLHLYSGAYDSHFIYLRVSVPIIDMKYKTICIAILAVKLILDLSDAF